jgi:hypothetical protein
MHFQHPNTMTEAERIAYRDARAGYSDGGQVERHIIAGGCYYLADRFGRHVAMGFQGKAIKPAFYYTFKTPEARAAYVAKWAESLRRCDEARAQRRADRRSDTHTLQVGAVLMRSWGYEQTNIDWYQVTAIVSDKMVVVRKIAGRIIPGEGISAMSGYTTPCLHQFVGEPMRVRAGKRGVSMKHGHASPWDGMPRYCSWYA